MPQDCSQLVSDWESISPTLQFSLSSEALKRARLIIGAQAQMLADQIDRGDLPGFDGPDALRLLAMILGQEDTPAIVPALDDEATARTQSMALAS